jgi:hypothetical protein
VERVAQKCAVAVIFPEMPKVYKRTLGENSPNLITLPVAPLISISCLLFSYLNKKKTAPAVASSFAASDPLL